REDAVTLDLAERAALAVLDFRAQDRCGAGVRGDVKRRGWPTVRAFPGDWAVDEPGLRSVRQHEHHAAELARICGPARRGYRDQHIAGRHAGQRLDPSRIHTGSIRIFDKCTVARGLRVVVAYDHEEDVAAPRERRAVRGKELDLQG